MQQWHSYHHIYQSSSVTPCGTSWLFGCVCLSRTATKQLEGKIMKQAFHVEHKKSGLTIIMCISVYAFITQSNTKECLSSSNAPPTPQKKLYCWQICFYQPYPPIFRAHSYGYCCVVKSIACWIMVTIRLKFITHDNYRIIACEHILLTFLSFSKTRNYVVSSSFIHTLKQ